MLRNLLLTFLSSCTGAYSGSALTNYSAGLHAWHLLHGHLWTIELIELKHMLQGAARLAPHSSKKPKQPPMTMEDIKIIHTHLDLDDPCNVAIFACMVVVFYCVARLGEFTVKTTRDFNASKHVAHHNTGALCDPGGLPVLQFMLPSTKCKPVNRETIQCALQPGCVTDPEAALRNHLRVNPGPASVHLFAWRHPKGGLHRLSKTQSTTHITSIVKRCSLANLQGHSLRIGGTLFYLLKGTPFDVVKVIGRWAGDAFTLYLRHHALILAPFLQADKRLLDNFSHIAMPPVC